MQSTFIVFFRFAFFFCLFVITYLAVVPQDQVFVSSGWDKLNHLIAFFVLQGLFEYSYPKLSLWRQRVPAMLFYGIAIELFQMLTPDRYGSWLDILSNCLGIVLFVLIIPLLDKTPLKSLK